MRKNNRLYPLDIINNLADMGQLHIGKAGHFNVTPAVQFQQVVGAYGKELGNLDQHFYGRKNVIILPVGNRLFRDVERIRKLYLVEASGLP